MRRNLKGDDDLHDKIISMKNISPKKAGKLLKKGKIGVIPTDTLYGLHTSALNPKSVEKVYKLKGRDYGSPFIILIRKVSDLKIFGIKIEKRVGEVIKQIWPARFSIILSCNNEKFKYLHRGINSLAFRVPDNKQTLEILKHSDPLISTTVNPQGKEPATTIKEAKKYFGKKVCFYYDYGKLKNKSSTLISLINNDVKILRQGDVKIPKNLYNLRND